MSLLSDAKEVVKLAHEAGNLPLYQRLVELQAEIVEISGQVLELEMENRSLKEAMELKAKMIFDKPYFYQDGDGVPFCPNCWESSRKAVHLVDSATPSRRFCTTCRSSYDDEWAGRPGPPRSRS